MGRSQRRANDCSGIWHGGQVSFTVLKSPPVHSHQVMTNICWALVQLYDYQGCSSHLFPLYAAEHILKTFCPSGSSEERKVCRVQPLRTLRGPEKKPRLIRLINNHLKKCMYIMRSVSNHQVLCIPNYILSPRKDKIIKRWSASNFLWHYLHFIEVK